jgi:hypothetical protein
MTTAISDDRLTRMLEGIAALTAVSGLVQMCAAGRVLHVLGAENTPGSRQGFATVGMFMTVIGGLQLQALHASEPKTGVVAWGATQKLGAAAAVAIGVRRGVFSRLALLVSAQDAASGVLAVAWCVRQRRRT